MTWCVQPKSQPIVSHTTWISWCCNSKWMEGKTQSMFLPYKVPVEKILWYCSNTMACHPWNSNHESLHEQSFMSIHSVQKNVQKSYSSPRCVGTVPDSWFMLTLIYCKSDKDPNSIGKDPPNLLTLRFKRVNGDSSPSSEGKCWVKAFSSAWISSSWCSSPCSEGSDPVKSLSFPKRKKRCCKYPIAMGIVPVIRFSAIKKNSMCVSSPSSEGSNLVKSLSFAQKYTSCDRFSNSKGILPVMGSPSTPLDMLYWKAAQVQMLLLPPLFSSFKLKSK